jgi:gamma-glutamylcyclotransferase (GGCT)/AIG2-like uncharacterized protein YtfP
VKDVKLSEASNLFAYGTLCVPVVIDKVMGRVPSGTKAKIKGYACFQVSGGLFPGARVSGPESEISGILYQGITPNEFALLDQYEDDFYERVSVHAFNEDASSGYSSAQVYIVPEEQWHVLSARPWDLEQFCSEDMESFLSERF